MTSYYDDYQETTHQSRHYESCLNSNCSRSPSPAHRQLWEPKHPPQKLNKKLPLKAIDITKHDTSHTKNTEKSPFLPPSRDYNGSNTPKRNRAPLFTYTINDGTNNGNGINSIEYIKTQKQFDSSPSSLGKKTPEQYESNPTPKDLASTGNLKLELELDTSRVPPIITIKNNNKIISQTPQVVQFTVSTPSTTYSQSCPYSSSPNTLHKSDLFCKCCAQLQPCSPQQFTQSCESICQPCCFPTKSSSRSVSKKDRATSPTRPCSTPQELEPSDSTSQDCSKCCPFSSSLRNRVDKAKSPIDPCSSTPSPSPFSSPSKIRVDVAISPKNSQSRSPSPSPLENLSSKPIHAHSSYNGDIGSQGTLEVNIDEATKVDIDWEGNVGPIHVDLPNSRTRNQYCRFEDQVHSHDPQLEAFYTSSNYQSGSPSPKSRSSSPPSPSLGGQNSRSAGFGPPWNPCHHIDHDCSNKAQSTSISPPRSQCLPSTSCSRKPQPKKDYQKELSQNNNFGSYESCTEDGDIRCPCSPSTICSRRSQSRTNSRKELSQNSFDSCEICSEDGEITTECNYTQCPYSGIGRFDNKSGQHRTDSPGQSSSPTLTLTPRSNGKGHMTIEWRNPRSIHEKRCKKIDPVFLHGKSPKEEYDGFGHSDQDRVAKEDSEISPRAITQVRRNPTSPNTNLERKTSMQSENQSCIPSCKPTCMLTPCTPPCDLCQGSNACCNDCCCCKRNCVAPMEGINKCTSLPPHLQSDWSASLRCPEGQVRTKPILYRDLQGHEHIMFADGSIEHLNRHCKPTTAIPPEPSPPPPLRMDTSPSPPLSKCPCQQRTFHEDEGRFEHSGAQNFSPRCGDIVLRARQRLPCLYPGKDNGQVAFFTSDYLDLQEGDSIVRLGKFDNSGRWCSSKRVEMYLRKSHGQWSFLGTTEGHPILYPLDADRHQIVRTPNKKLKLKSGDLVISTCPGPNSFYFWNPQTKLDCDHSHLLLRAYIGQPQIVDENHNLACCVMGHLPVGYVELYVKVKRIWLFLGRDEHMFSEHELTYFRSLCSKGSRF